MISRLSVFFHALRRSSGGWRCAWCGRSGHMSYVGGGTFVCKEGTGCVPYAYAVAVDKATGQITGGL